MRKRKRFVLAAYVLAMLAVTVWLCVSTDVITQMSGLAIPEKIDLDDYMYAKDYETCYGCIDNVQVTSTLSENIGFSGWMFVQTQEKNQNRRVALIFKGEEDCYAFNMSNLIKRTDVLNAFPDMSIPSARVGFTGDFATAGMKDGVYTLFYYCYENEKDYSLQDTGQRFKKEGNLLEPV